MVATPRNRVTRCVANAPRTGSGEKLPESTTRAPMSNGARRDPCSPKEWGSGNTDSTTSSGVTAIMSAHERSAKVKAAWLNTAPLGRPVLPEL